MTLIYHRDGELCADRRLITPDPIIDSTSYKIRISEGKKIHVNPQNTFAVGITGGIPSDWAGIFGNVHAFLELLHEREAFKLNDGGLPYVSLDAYPSVHETLKDISSFILMNRHRVYSTNYLYEGKGVRCLYEVTSLGYTAIGSGETAAEVMLIPYRDRVISNETIFAVTSVYDRMVSAKFDVIKQASLKPYRLNKAIRQYITDLYPFVDPKAPKKD